MAAVIIIAMVLAPAGAYTIAVMVIQSLGNRSFDSSRLFLNEAIKDFIYDRSLFRLERSEFPIIMRNDIEAYLSRDNFIRWNKRYNMMSRRMQGAGITDSGLPTFWFTLLCVDDSREVYETMIRTICSDILRLAHCTETRVIIDWHNTPDKDFLICCVTYARTATEEESFMSLLKFKEAKILGADSMHVTDPELDEALRSVKKGGRNDRK